MNVYWLYDLPTWLFGLLSVAVTVTVGLVGFYATRKWARRVPQNSADALMAIQTHLASFEPVTEGQKTLHAEAYRQFDRVVELRRIRLRSVLAGLPAPLWSVVLVGAFISIALTWFFDMRSRSMHFWMTVMFSGLLGLLMFLLAAMDNPFRGEISVGPEAFKLVYEELMKPVK